ncbi:MAG TPA: hypothetical protein VN947_26750 [Polyangia bacterium]|nr:hypothetical protein [Polyangia bacterium]
MKKIDYYAVQNPWRMPKWLGATLGGIFGVIVIGSMITIVQLTRSPTPAPVAAVAMAPVATAAPTAAPAAAAVAPAKAVSAPVASADDAAPVAKKHAKRHAKAAKHGRMLASAKRSSDAGSTQRQTIIAKHDTKSKRTDKDALDKLLGL